MRTAFAFALLAAPAFADDAPRYRFASGDSMLYRVEQATTVRETTLDDKTSRPVTATVTTKLGVLKRWDVKAADAESATLEVTPLAIRQEVTRPGPADKDGKPTTDVVVVDSATEEGAKVYAAYLNKPAIRVKVDPRGQLLAAESLTGAPFDARAKADLPFRLTFPAGPAREWQRAPAVITLDPPAGSGEKVEVRTTFRPADGPKGFASFALSTALHNPPADAGLMPGLVPLLWEGVVHFRPTDGKLHEAELSVKQAVANHQGAGTRFEYESKLIETLEK